MLYSTIGIIHNARESSKAQQQFCTTVVIPLRGIVESALSSSSRNPLPPGLTPEQQQYYDTQRAVYAERYGEWIKLLDRADCQKL